MLAGRWSRTSEGQIEDKKGLNKEYKGVRRLRQDPLVLDLRTSTGDWD